MRLYDALRLNQHDVVAFVGGGGKTTAMFRLADEIVAQGGRVVTTTTTRIFAAQTRLAPYAVQLDTLEALPELLPALLDQHPHVLLTGVVDDDSGKAFGLPADAVEAIQAAIAPELAPIIVEADGSRMRPFKAPADHEPVIPPTASVVVPVAGVDVIGKPLDEDHVHRAGLAAGLLGVPAGAPVTADMVARLLAHEAGGRKGVPPHARWTPLINKVESGRLSDGRAVAGALLDMHATEVLLGAAKTAVPVCERWGRVAVVLLAAGASSRMSPQGEIKQLLPWQGVPLVAHAAGQAQASHADACVVVAGNQAGRVLAALAGRDVLPTVNDNWADGQSTSVQAGLRALPEETRAAIFMLVDQPFIEAALVDALIDEYRRSGAPIVAARAGGRRANPVLFDISTWPSLNALSGDTGGRPLFDAYADRIAWVDADERILVQIDTPADYRRLLEMG